MSREELYTAEGDVLLGLIQAGATQQLLRVAPNWTSEEAKSFSEQLEMLFWNIDKLPGSRGMSGANHRSIVLAKLDCLKAASKVNTKLFKKIYEEIASTHESYSTDFKRYWRRAYSLPNRTFMKVDEMLNTHDLRREAQKEE